MYQVARVKHPGTIACVLGGVVMALVMLLALPTAVMVAGMVWNALSDLVLSDAGNHVLRRPQRLRSYSV